MHDRDLNRTYEKAKGGIFQPRADKPAEDVIFATWKSGGRILGIRNLVDEVSFILRLLYPTGKNPATLRTGNWKFYACTSKLAQPATIPTYILEVISSSPLNALRQMTE